MNFHRLIGDRAFYRKLFAVMVPILIQNVITNFVSLLDNVMVGQVGTEPMSGVAIVNQLLFIFNLCVFGGLAGAGIFTAQFFGKNDPEGIRYTMRIKLMIGAATVVVFGAVLVLHGETLIGLFLHEGSEALDLAVTMTSGKEYLAVMLVGLIPFAGSQIYASTLRECGETVLPMKAGIAAVFVNLTFDYILIFGKLGAPVLGVVGAAIATVLSRFVEFAVVWLWSLRHRAEHPYMRGAFRSLHVPGELLRRTFLLGMPLLLNELFWSGGMTVLNQCYSLRGLEVVSAMNIATTVSNLFFCAVFAMGSTISILVGQLLGAGELERAVDEDWKLIAFTTVVGLLMGLLMAVTAPLIPRVYNTTVNVKLLATSLLLVTAVLTPLHAFLNGCYFTLRSGGKTIITFIFDSAFVWLMCIPLAFVLSRFTAMPSVPMYACVEALNIFKCILGYVLVKNRRWVKNLVDS
ncbi:MAG: MATE family efflux transporter [Oscillospiraceae bacterium]|nr:MATE family efflux transporter [Oscillospiraceae bacterium]